MIRLIPQIPRYWFARASGRGAPLPVNVTASLTYRCQSRCRTCRVYERSGPELAVEEWRKVFAGLVRAPYWLTFSGGEPFLRPDTPRIVRAAIETCRPGVVNIPTNGLLPERIVDATMSVCDVDPRTRIIVNVSLDAVGEHHDEIRGVPGAYEKAVETLRKLLGAQRPNLTVGVHTVISRFNAAAIREIVPRLIELGPDSYVTEVAEERVELGTVGLDITPDAESYWRAVDHVEAALARYGGDSVSSLVRAFRTDYHRMARRYLRSGRLTIPCYAGLASAQIAPNGDLWFCCVRAEPVGNLKEADYDFRAVWGGEAARLQRRLIRRRECACPLANAAYTNMLCHPPTMVRVLWRYAVGSRARRPRSGAAGRNLAGHADGRE